MIKTLLALLMVPLISCTNVLRRLDVGHDIPKRPPEPSQGQTACTAPSQKSPQLVGSNREAQEGFTKFLRDVDPAGSLEFREKIVLWSLLQVNIRPDLASPTARFQFLIKEDGVTRYHDFGASTDGPGAFPFFAGLSQLLGQTKNKRPLMWYARLLDGRLKTDFFVDKYLADNLYTLRQKIAENPELRQHFFRGDDVLHQTERMSRVNFSALVSRWERDKKPTPSQETLFPYRKTPTLDVRCNYDFTLYDNSIFLIDKEDNTGHQFGLSQKNEAFLGVVAQKLSTPSTLFGQPIFAGSAQVRSSAFCVIKRTESEIWVSANQSRDPGQHVYHLFRYGLSQAASNKDITKLLGHARHMFLSDPTRLIIESARSTDKQINELLKLNVPIYNSPSIGNIWAWADFQSKGGIFFIDERNPGALFCSP